MCRRHCYNFAGLVANMAWFNTLNTSHLNLTENRSVNAKFLKMPTSSCEIPGCRRLLRPAFPTGPVWRARRKAAVLKRLVPDVAM